MINPAKKSGSRSHKLTRVNIEKLKKKFEILIFHVKGLRIH